MHDAGDTGNTVAEQAAKSRLRPVLPCVLTLEMPKCVGEKLMNRTLYIQTILILTISTIPSAYTLAQNTKVFGEDFISSYSVTKNGNRLLLSADIPDKYGEIQKGKGMLSVIRKS